MKIRARVLAAVALGFVMGATPALAQDGGAVTIYRGAQAETVRFDNRAGVTVVRGQPAAQPAVSTERRAGRHTFGRTVAGDTLWIVDAKTERLVACELYRTTQVGERRIGCVERALPVAFR
jgi:hypothetical protein